VTSELDLGRFVQRRQLRSYEQDLARSVYAYGVDVRRFQWLSHSLTGQTALRALELGWVEHAKLMMSAGELQYPEGADSLPILQEIVQSAELLHAGLPGIRLVTAKGRAALSWPLVTPLSNSRGGDAWLVVDREALALHRPPARAFLLGQALGHLQCGHGCLFVAHLVGARTGKGVVLRQLLRPWSQVAAFSADRAGLLAAGDLDTALELLGREVAPAWFPHFAPRSEREHALREFDRSRVIARVRSHQRYRREGAAVEEIVAALHPDPSSEPEAPGQTTPPEVPADAWPLARCDQRLTHRLGLF